MIKALTMATFRAGPIRSGGSPRGNWTLWAIPSAGKRRYSSRAHVFARAGRKSLGSQRWHPTGWDKKIHARVRQIRRRELCSNPV